MAKNEQQRQKKLAKKRSKDILNRRVLAQKRQALNSWAGQMQRASAFPVYRCYLADSIFEEQGLGIIYLAREMGDGRMALMFLLIDRHCLGVKDAGGRFCTRSELTDLMERSRQTSSYHTADPSRARKLTEDAIAYAHSLGFSPHPDYRKFSPLWGDIDATQCDETFEFGLDGKPSYVAGPYDDEARQNLIFRRLCAAVGEGNFHFAVGGIGTMPAGFSSLDFTPHDDDDLADEDDDDDVQLLLDGPELPRIQGK